MNALLSNSQNSRNNPHYLHELHKLQAELNKIREHKIKGTILRSKVRWHEKGEKNSRYFLNLENRAACKKKVTKLLLEDSTETNDPDVILKKQEEFLSNLYKSQGPSVANSNCCNFFNSKNMTTLSEEMSNSCEGKIASDECLLALKEFENGKSPSSDGFTAEFYKFFWKELS